MKSTTLLVLALPLPSTLANFHIMWGDTPTFEYGNPVGIFGSILVPSDSYNCDTMFNSNNEPGYNTEAAGPGEAIDFMRFSEGICKSGVLNFRYRPERDEYDVYLENGDGTVLGWCYFSRGPTTKCPPTVYFPGVF